MQTMKDREKQAQIARVSGEEDGSHESEQEGQTLLKIEYVIAQYSERKNAVALSQLLRTPIRADLTGKRWNYMTMTWHAFSDLKMIRVSVFLDVVTIPRDN